MQGYGFENSPRRSEPHPLDDYLSSNARKIERRDSDGGVRNIGICLLFVTFVVFGAIYWGLKYL